MVEGLEFRISVPEDRKYLIEWLNDPKILRWFPMSNYKEVLDASAIWMSYIEKKGVFTAVLNGTPVGIANIYVPVYKRFEHQCLFAIIVDEKHRGKGIGSALMQEIVKQAKERFHIEMLHLEVYKGNPAIHLYERLGFKQYGIHKKFFKEQSGEYLDKILMYKFI